LPPVVIAVATEISAIAANVAIATGASFATVNAVSAFAYSASTIAITTGLVAGIGLALAPKVPHPSIQQTPLKQPIPPRTSGFGRARLGGKYALYAARSGLSLNVQLCHDGEIDGWERFWLNDDEVFLDGSSGVIAAHGTRYGMIDGVTPRVYVYQTLGTSTGPGFPAIASAVPDLWTADHRCDFIAALGSTAKQGKLNDQSGLFPNGDPLVSGAGRLQKCYDPRLHGIDSMGDPATWVWTANPVLHRIRYLCTTDTGGMGLSFAKRIKPNIDKWIRAADICDEAVEVGSAETFLTATAHTGDHSVKLYGVNALDVGSTIVINRGTGTEETRAVLSIDGSTVTIDPELSYDHVSGEPVEWTRTVVGTEPRYEAHGTYDWSTAPKDVLAQLIACDDGWLCPAGDGSLITYSGQYYEPTITFTDDHVIGYSISGRPADEEAVNQLLASFTDPNRAFNQADGGTWDDPFGDQARRGKVRSQPFNVPWSHSIGQTGRLAQRAVTRAAQPLRGWVKTNLYGMNGLGNASSSCGYRTTRSCATWPSRSPARRRST
jgi:hypothetical protein